MPARSLFAPSPRNVYKEMQAILLLLLRKHENSYKGRKTEVTSMCTHVCVVHCVAMLQVTTHTGDRRGRAAAGGAGSGVAVALSPWPGEEARAVRTQARALPVARTQLCRRSTGHSGRRSDTRRTQCPVSASRGTSARRKRFCFAFRSLGFVGPAREGACPGGRAAAGSPEKQGRVPSLGCRWPRPR